MTVKEMKLYMMYMVKVLASCQTLKNEISRCGCTGVNKLSFRACSNRREENTEAFEVNCECCMLMMIALYFFSESNRKKQKYLFYSQQKLK